MNTTPLRPMIFEKSRIWKARIFLWFFGFVGSAKRRRRWESVSKLYGHSKHVYLGHYQPFERTCWRSYWNNNSVGKQEPNHLSRWKRKEIIMMMDPASKSRCKCSTNLAEIVLKHCDAHCSLIISFFFMLFVLYVTFLSCFRSAYHQYNRLNSTKIKEELLREGKDTALGALVSAISTKVLHWIYHLCPLDTFNTERVCPVFPVCVCFFLLFLHLLQWKALAETEKKYYEELAEQDKQRYLRECAVCCVLVL